MTVGFGNSKKQAERNASIQGCNWLERYRITHKPQTLMEDTPYIEEDEDGDEEGMPE